MKQIGTIWLGNSAPLCLSKGKEDVHTKIYMWKFIAAWFITTPNRRQPKCPLTGESINNFWCIHKIEYDPCGSDGKESACNVGTLGSIPGSGRSPGEGNGNPLQYSCLGNSMDKRAWQATVHGVERVRHDWVTNTFFFHSSRKQQTPLYAATWMIYAP